jgi:DNA-binding transcriptional ArsR family regulator
MVDIESPCLMSCRWFDNGRSSTITVLPGTDNFDVCRTMGRMSSETLPSFFTPEREDIRIGEVLHALADPVRLEMVRQLAGTDELACGGFDVPVTKSTLTHHLRTLREAGVIAARQSGTTRYNSLRRKDLDELFPGLLNGVLTARR